MKALRVHQINLEGRPIHFTGRNPFDKSYHLAQATYDLNIGRLLCETINATMKIIANPRVTNVSVYERNPNAWVVEQLTEGTADMSSHSLVLTPDSEKVVDYSVAIGTFRPQIYFKAQSIRMAKNIYLVPLSVDTWITLMCLLLIITVVMTFILSRETRLPHQTPYDLIARIADEKHEKGIDWNKIDSKMTAKDNIPQREHWEITEILLVSSGALCQQGSERDPSTAAARTLLLALFVMAVLIYTAYSASLISLISLLPDTDEEIHEWTARNGTELLLQDTNYFRSYPIEIGQYKLRFTTVEDGLTRVLQEDNTAFVADRDESLTTFHNMQIGTDSKCSLARAFPGLEYQRVFAMRLNAQFKTAKNYNILKLRQHGIISRERKILFKRYPPCSSKERSSLSGFVSVDLSDTLPALLLLLWGYVVAVAFLSLEFFIFYSYIEAKNKLGETWRDAEKHAGRVLDRWMKIKLLEDYRRNEDIVVGDSTKENTIRPKFLH